MEAPGPAAALPGPSDSTTRTARIKDLRIEIGDLPGADERPHMLVDVLAIPGHGAAPAGVLVEVAVEQLVDRRRGLRVAPLLEPGEKVAADRIRLVPGFRPGWDDLHQVVSAPGDRVDTRVDAEGSTGQLIDAALLTPSRVGCLRNERDDTAFV